MTTTATWKKFLTFFMATCVALAFIPAFHSNAEAATVKQTGSYLVYMDGKEKMSSSAITTKGYVFYKKSGENYGPGEAKEMKPAIRTYKLTGKTKYYYFKGGDLQKKTSKSFAKKHIGESGKPLLIKVKSGKVIKVVFY